MQPGAINTCASIGGHHGLSAWHSCRRGIYWVPTVAVGVYVAAGRQGNWPKMVETEKAAFRLALNKGVKIVLGTDAGGFDWRDLNEAKEF